MSGAPPLVVLPGQFDGHALSKLAADVIDCWSPDGAPGVLTFDFSKLNFIRPAGVVFLSNLILWLDQKGTTVQYVGTTKYTGPLSFLDDSLFFEQHWGKKLKGTAAPRDTTKPLMRIAHERSHAWLDQSLLPWLSGRLRISEASLRSFRVCLSELFNNIKDHTQHEDLPFGWGFPFPPLRTSPRAPGSSFAVRLTAAGARPL